MDREINLSLVSFLPEQEPLVRRMKATYRLMQREGLSESGGDSWLRSKSYHAARLTYQQVLDEATGETFQEILTARLDPEGIVQALTMKRPSGAFRLEFAPGKTFVTEYPTPAGLLDVAIRTIELTGRFTEDKVWASLRYETWLGEDLQGETKLEIRGTV